MKKLLLYLTLFITCGCSSLGGSPVTETTGCREISATLDENDVQNIVLNEEKTITESGQVSANKPVGYLFEAKAGQKLSYKTDDDICISIYRPDTTPLNSGDLPTDGKYTLQVSVPQGSTTFSLDMSLGTLQSSASSKPPSTASTTTTSPTKSPSPKTSSSTSTQVDDITQEKAVDLVNQWLKAKPEIFAPPFNDSLVAKLTTGKRYIDITKTDGSINWLRNNGSYWKYKTSKITDVWSFSSSSPRPELKVTIYEDATLYGNRGIDHQKSGATSENYIYYFAKDNGIWKIYDSKQVD